MFLKNLFKKEEKAEQKKTSTINIGNLLTEEEIKLLVTDLGLIENKVDAAQRQIIIAAEELAQSGAAVAPEVLNLYIVAVQSAIDMFAAFNMVPSGTAGLLDKLQSIKENLN